MDADTGANQYQTATAADNQLTSFNTFLSSVVGDVCADFSEVLRARVHVQVWKRNFASVK